MNTMTGHHCFVVHVHSTLALGRTATVSARHHGSWGQGIEKFEFSICQVLFLEHLCGGPDGFKGIGK